MLKNPFNISQDVSYLVSIASYLLFLLLTLVASSKAECIFALSSTDNNLLFEETGSKRLWIVRDEKEKNSRAKKTWKYNFHSVGKARNALKRKKKVGRNFNIILIGTILIGISLSTFNLCEQPSALLIAHPLARLDFPKQVKTETTWQCKSFQWIKESSYFQNRNLVSQSFNSGSSTFSFSNHFPLCVFFLSCATSSLFLSSKLIYSKRNLSM